MTTHEKAPVESFDLTGDLKVFGLEIEDISHGCHLLSQSHWLVLLVESLGDELVTRRSRWVGGVWCRVRFRGGRQWFLPQQSGRTITDWHGQVWLPLKIFRWLLGVLFRSSKLET